MAFQFIDIAYVVSGPDWGTIYDAARWDFWKSPSNQIFSTAALTEVPIYSPIIWNAIAAWNAWAGKQQTAVEPIVQNIHQY